MKKLNRINKIIISTLFASSLVACGGGGGGGSSSGGTPGRSSATSITPLTCLHKETLPALVGGGEIKHESGSQGSVKMDCRTSVYSVDGASMNVTDLKREITMDLVCTEPERKNLTLVWKADYKTGVSTWNWKDERGQEVGCKQKHNSPLDTTIANNDSVAKLLSQWGSDFYANGTDFISSDCPADGVQSEEVGNFICSNVIHTNYTITDDASRIHKLATRTSVPAIKIDSGSSSGGSSSGGSSSGGSSSGGSSSGGSSSGGSGSGDFSSVTLTGAATTSLGITSFQPTKISDNTISIMGSDVTTISWIQETVATHYELVVSITKLLGVETVSSVFHKRRLESGMLVIKSTWTNSVFSGDVNADDVEFRDTTFSNGTTELIINGTLKRKE